MADGLIQFRDDLLAWYDVEKRDLPWRRTTDPYSIWVSEIMLQQTTVAAVVSYYERWMERFPTVESLAVSEIEEALSIWQGLGYYRRCRNLHAGAKVVASNGFPEDAAGWLALPGIGAYTAGAICSIAFELPTPAVDGNVERVYARVHTDDDLNLKRPATDWANKLVQHSRPGDVTQALMELGATVCKPVAPACGVCPVGKFCEANSKNTQDQLPKRKSKRETIELSHAVCVPYINGRLGVRKIKEGEWWEGLYEFPRESSQQALSKIVGTGKASKLCQFKHTVTHHKISITASLMHVESESEHLEWIDPCNLDALPMPSPQRRIAKLAITAIKDQICENSMGVASAPSSDKK